MKTPDAALRKHFQTLAVVGAKIYDRAADNQATPYIHISDIRADNYNTATEYLYQCDVLFDIVTAFPPNTGGRMLADSIGESLLSLLNDNRAEVDEFKINRCQLLSTNYMDEYSEAETIIRKLIRVEFIVEQIN